MKSGLLSSHHSLAGPSEGDEAVVAAAKKISGATTNGSDHAVYLDDLGEIPGARPVRHHGRNGAQVCYRNPRHERVRVFYGIADAFACAPRGLGRVYRRRGAQMRAR